MSTWRERLIEERRELNEKLVKLNAFLAMPDFQRPAKIDLAEEDRLKRQTELMRQYSDVLSERLAASENAPA